MLRLIRNYPVSLSVILVVTYLSFFKPPSVPDELERIPHLDKVVHLCMYLGMAGMLWIEFLRAHRRQAAPLWHAWIGAVGCPILFSGGVELLQEYCTDYRGGDWWDFAANTVGVLLATFLVVRLRRWPFFRRCCGGR